MRISTALSQHLSVNAIVNQQAKLAKTQLQLSTGSKILTPAEAPSASAKALNLIDTIDVTGQYQANGETARSRLSLEDTTLENATNILQRARELAVQGANGSLNASDRLAIEQEVRELLNQMESIANTKAPNGEYIFSGIRSDVSAYKWHSPMSTLAPISSGYVFQGDGQQRTLQVSPSRWLADGDAGVSVFGKVPAVGAWAEANGGTQNIFTTLYNFAEALAGRAPAILSPTLPDTPEKTISDTLTNLDNAIDNVGRIRASVGTRLQILDDQSAINEKFIEDTKAVLSGIQDVDYAEAISQFNQQSVALQAAQQAYVRVQGLSLFNYLR
jgi:flagellar hook-associated protein 3 FlgL